MRRAENTRISLVRENEFLGKTREGERGRESREEGDRKNRCWREKRNSNDLLIEKAKRERERDRPNEWMERERERSEVQCVTRNTYTHVGYRERKKNIMKVMMHDQTRDSKLFSMIPKMK